MKYEENAKISQFVGQEVNGNEIVTSSISFPANNAASGSGLSDLAWNVLGWAWNSSNTQTGVLYGLLGIPTQGISYSNGQLNFHGNLAQTAFASVLGMDPIATTLGHAAIYGRGVDPWDIGRSGYPLGYEESMHSAQGDIMGPFYIPMSLAFGLYSVVTTGDWWNSPLEQGPHQTPPSRGNAAGSRSSYNSPGLGGLRSGPKDLGIPPDYGTARSKMYTRDASCG